MSKSKFGLSERERQLILNAFQAVPAVNKVVIFGSRALGNFKPGSDIDLAIIEGKVDTALLLNLNVQLNEHTNLPYKFDLLNYSTISDQELKNHIDQCGQLFFLRNVSSGAVEKG